MPYFASSVILDRTTAGRSRLIRAPRSAISIQALKEMQMQTASMDALNTDRIAVVDILRAVALFGIIINHASLSYLAGLEPDPLFNILNALDRIVLDLAELLTFGKFFAIFSFLFGLSFAIQLDSAARKGTRFAGRFAWRLAILFAIGFVHSLFFSGDVLMIYALLGLLLIPCRKWKNKTLLITGVILVLNIPGMLLGALQLSFTPSPEQQQTALEFQASFAEQAKEQFRIKQSGTFAELAETNLTQSNLSRALFMVFTGRLWITFGYFLLGMLAGRVMLFKQSDDHARLFRKLLVWSGVVAFITSTIHLLHPSEFQEASLSNLLSYSAFTLQQSSLATFIVCCITLWYWRKPRGEVWASLAATGRMGLTTYLLQTAFGVILFFGIGFGLLGKIGAAASVASAIAFFFFEIVFARWWLQHFKMGPFEWLWRSLTYFKVQPNSRTQLTV
jgi:uncharacterized protein